MKLLLRAALLNRKHALLLLVTLFSLLLLTVVAQMEMLCLGVIAKPGPDAFALFGAKEHAHELTLGDIQARWGEITGDGEKEVLTKQEAHAYLATHSDGNLLQRILALLNSRFDVEHNLRALAAILIAVALTRAVVQFTQSYFSQLIGIRVSRDLRLRYFEHIQSLPMSFYNDYDIGTLSSRVVGDASILATSTSALLINYIQTPFSILTAFLACLFISWKLSLVIFVGFPLLVGPVIYIAKRIKLLAKQMQRGQEGFASVLIDFLSGVHTVKVFAMEEFAIDKYSKQNQRIAKLEERSARYSLASRPILHAGSSLFFAAVIFAGLYLFHVGPAELLVFCGLLYLFYEPVKKFAEGHNQVLRGVAAAERMFEVLDIRSPISDRPNALPLTAFSKEIEFCNVSFRYKEEWVLSDVSFKVRKGETVAIVGPTGAGKSTIVQLIPRLYDVQEGEIRIDGKPLQDYQQKSLREQIGFVPQRPFLFLDTVRENITFGRTFSDEEVHLAARRAHAEEFIEALPKQYEEMLAEGGKNLSGGQQQRLAIARALVKRAPILIMDEATSSLDALSEEKIKLAITELHGNVTQIIIAHRFSTIEHADRIIYLEKGRKVAEGTRAELLEICPSFRLMWETMYKNSEQNASKLCSEQLT